MINAEGLSHGDIIVGTDGRTEGTVSGKPEVRDIGEETYIFVSLITLTPRRSTYSTRGLGVRSWVRTYKLGDLVEIKGAE